VGAADDIVELHGVSMGSDLDAVDQTKHKLLVLWTGLRSGDRSKWIARRRFSDDATNLIYFGKVTLNAKPDVVPASEPNPAVPINKSGVKTPIAVRVEPTLMTTVQQWPSTSVDVNSLFPSTAEGVAKDIDITSFGG